MALAQKNIMVTDLDQTDNEEKRKPEKNSIHRKGGHKRKTLHTLSGNFNRRSRSAESNLQKRSAEESSHNHGHRCSKEKAQGYLNELLQAKEQQLEKLLQRLTTLHKYNDQFAYENQQLQQNVHVLQGRIEDLRKKVADCSKCQQLSRQLDTTLEEQQTLDADVKMLKTLVYRLNVQIEAYQDQLRLIKNNQNDDNEFLPQAMKTSITTNEWRTGALSTHTLAPLLSSYDEMLHDREELIQQYRQEFEHFTGELKRTIEENNRLLQQNESLKRDFGNWREERTRLHAQLEVCRTKVEAHARKSDLAKEKLVDVMHCYEQKVQTLVLDLEHTQSAYIRCKTELATLKSIGVQPQDNIAQSLQECKELLEELKLQHSKEKKTFQCTIDDLNVQKQSFQNRTKELEHENTNLRREMEQKVIATAEFERRFAESQHALELVKQSRNRLKARLRIAMQWAQRLEEGQTNIQNTWDALKRLETVVKHKESQVRGLQVRHVQEIDKMEKKLAQKEETIRTILKGKLSSAMSTEINK